MKSGIFLKVRVVKLRSHDSYLGKEIPMSNDIVFQFNASETLTHTMNTTYAQRMPGRLDVIP